MDPTQNIGIKSSASQSRGQTPANSDNAISISPETPRTLPTPRATLKTCVSPLHTQFPKAPLSYTAVSKEEDKNLRSREETFVFLNLATFTCGARMQRAWPNTPLTLLLTQDFVSNCQAAESDNGSLLGLILRSVLKMRH